MRRPIVVLLGPVLLLTSMALLTAIAEPERPAPVSAQGSSRVPPSACSAVVTETIGTDPLPVCRTADVTVTVGVTCPTSLPLHIVFTIGKHLLMQDHLNEVKASARDVLNQIEFTPGTMVGVVTLSAQSNTELELTEQKSLALSAINRIRLDPIDPTVRYYDWIGKAQQMLEKARDDVVSPIEVIVLYSTGCPTGFESYCDRQAGSANKAKGQDMTIVGVCNPRARPFGFPWPDNHCLDIRKMASDGWYYDLQQASQVGPDVTELGRTGSGMTVDVMSLVERLAPSLAIVPGSAAGSPSPKIEPGSVSWEWSALQPGAVLTATYGLSPTLVGQMPLRLDDSAAEIVDSKGRVSPPFAVPTRSLEIVPCVIDTPTPSPSPTVPASATPTTTATATRTSTPLPTATPVPPHPVYVPLALRRACRPEEQHSDVVLAIDASSSMRDESAGVSKIEAAQSAAIAFVGIMDLEQDQAAVVAFNEHARLASQLTGNGARLEQAIAGIETAPGTRLDRALDMATEELDSPRTRPGNNRVIVLLTDGRPTQGTTDQVLASAAAAKGRGVLIFAVGLGDDVDETLLRGIASEPGFVLLAPTAADLKAIYERIAGALPCPGGAVWLSR